MNQRPTIREQMDACRPDSDDLFLPEHAADLAELQAACRDRAEVRAQFEHSQQDGRVIRGAMQDVVLPVGLEARLLAAVQAAQAQPLAGVQQAVREDSSAANIQVVPAKKSRRWFSTTVVGSLASMAALVLLGVWGIQSLTRNEQPITRDQLASQVQDWLQSVDVKTMTKPTKTVVLPRGVLGSVTGSSSITSRQGPVTAYSVKLRGGGSNATVLAIPTSREYPVSATPYSTVPGISGGWNVGAWQQDRILYIIAVPDNSGTTLDQFVPRQPIG